MTEPTLTLLTEKLVKVAASIHGVDKAGRNEAQRYDYVKATDVVQEVRDKLLAEGVLFYLDWNVYDIKVIDRGDKPPQILYTLDGYATACYGVERLSFNIAGSGMDVGDKGLYKAITGMWKYAIRVLFQIPDEKDDPEVERKDEKEEPATRPVVVGSAKADAPAATTVKPPLASEAQRKLIRARAREKGLDSENLKAFVIFTTTKHSSLQLTTADVDTILAALNDPELVKDFTQAKVAAV